MKEFETQLLYYFSNACWGVFVCAWVFATMCVCVGMCSEANKRTLGRAKVNELINEWIDSLLIHDLMVGWMNQMMN